MARDDGLPHPVSVADLYLAAILDEIRDLKSILNPVVPVSDEIVVKEPERNWGRYKKKA